MVALEQLSDALQHPFVLLLVTVGLSGGLITWLTHWLENRRQKREIEVENNRKGLEVKTDIASKMAEAIALLDAETSLIIYHEKQLDVEEKKTFFQVLRKWYIDTITIRSKLEAYFPDTDIKAKWDAHFDLLDTFATGTFVYFDLENALHQENPVQRKILLAIIDEIKRILSKEDSIKSELDSLSTTFNYDHWHAIHNVIRRRGGDIIKDSLNLKIKLP